MGLRPTQRDENPWVFDRAAQVRIDATSLSHVHVAWSPLGRSF